MHKKILLIVSILVISRFSYSQNLLAIPDTLSGTVFNLNIRDTNKVFYPGFTTNTFGINAAYLGPTLMLNKGDSISVTFYNQLMDTTTIHWHGMHVSAMNDGGPHITIPPISAWNPTFKVRDHAAMYWYHPHMHMMTNLHASLGAAGLVIVRDSTEATLNLPRRYGIDDFPLVIQSKCFDANKQIVIGNASDSVMMVNGTINPYLPVPAQVVRLRLLNASSERVYNLGFQGNLSFFQIGSDGGLLNAPVSLTRLRLAPGERAEILIDLSGKNGQNIYLKSFASELPNAIYGATQPGMGAGQTIPGYTANVLNGADFNILLLNVMSQTALPVTSIPSTLVNNTIWPVASANGFKTLTFSPVNPGPTAIQGPFLINNTSFDMNVVNYNIPLDNIEVWTLTNQSPIAHPFHIHDIQFYVTEINGAAPPANLAGRKDVILVPAMQTIKFITKFETFCDTMNMYMYHCHMLPHEDEGMMGQFVVSCPKVDVGVENILDETNAVTIYPNPAQHELHIKSSASDPIQGVVLRDLSGKILWSKQKICEAEQTINVESYSATLYILEVKTRSGIIQHQLIRSE
ncbi:MAG: multicopper oxidase domain-containing protein [Chitinophagaceae bacterium]|nr:multicopper oxidase domain-containing protein [Chitinophagaceae bacterium]